VDRLKIAVCEVGRHFAVAFLLVERLFGQIFPEELHRQTDDVLAADLEELVRLQDILLRVDDQQRNGQEETAEFRDRVHEFTVCRELVTNLEQAYHFANSP